MEPYKNIEQRMHSLAEKQSTPPPMMVWDNIETTLDKGNDRRGVWFFSLLGLILFGASLFFMTSDYPSLGIQPQQSLVENDNKTVEALPIAIVDEEEKIEQSQEIEKTQTNEETIIESTVSKINEEQTKKTSTQDVFMKSEASKVIKSSVKHASNQEKKNLTSDVTFNSEESKKSLQIVSSESIEEFDNSLYGQLPVPSFSEENRVLKPVYSITNHIRNVEAEDNQVSMNKEIECPSFKKKGMSLNPFIEVNGFFGLPNKSMTTSQNSHLLQSRQNSESNWYLWGGNVGIGLNITPSFYAGIGLEWSQSKDKFAVSKDAIGQVVINFDPSTNLPIDTSYLVGLLVNKGEIRYTTIDVPVYIGYGKSIGTWGFGVEAGALINMSHKANGKIINESNDISHIHDEGQIYKEKIGLGLRASIVARKYLSNGLSLQIKPTFKTYFNDLQIASYPIKTRSSMMRVELGLRKDF